MDDPEAMPFDLLLTNMTISNNSAVNGAGLYLQGGNTTTHSNVTISNNTAIQSAGGVYLGGQGKLEFGQGILIRYNNATQAGGLGWYSSCSNLNACQPSVLLLPCTPFVENNTAKVVGGGMMVDVQRYVFEQQCARDATLHNSAAFGNPDFFIVTTGCQAGEVSKGGWCDRCPGNMYAFEQAAKECSVCPEGAVCPGGNVIVPQPGFWHSYHYSTQIHKCPNPAACNSTKTQEEQLALVSKQTQASDAADTLLVNTSALMSWQCAAGYQGNGCGKCSATYGLTSPFRCSLCRSKQSTIALYAAAYVCLVLLVTGMAYSTWSDNRSGSVELRVSDILKVLVLFGWYLVILASVRIDWPKSLSAIFTAISWLLSSSSGEVVSLECLLASSSSSLPWGLPQAMVRHLIYAILPLVTVVAVTLLHLLAWVVYAVYNWCDVSPRESWGFKRFMEGRIRVIVMVVLYFFYPSLLRVCFSMFACFMLDGGGSAQSMYAVANAAYGYWVYDMEQPCWDGWHFRWALGLGVVGVFLLCVALPAAVVWWLRSNKALINEPAFRLHYGFLYRNFRPHRFYWGAVMALQTAVLVCIAVYSSVVGSYFELLMFAFVFSMIMVLQLWFRLFAFKRLHQLQLMAMGLLYATAFIALSFISVEKESNDIYKEVIGAVLLALIGAFLCWCIYNIYAVGKGSLSGWVGFLQGAWVGVVAAASRCRSCCSCWKTASPAAAAGAAAGATSKDRSNELMLPGQSQAQEGQMVVEMPRLE